MTLEIPKTEPKRPMYLDRFSSAMISVIKVSMETIRPAAPTPVTVLPKIRMLMLGAAAHSMEPTSKIAMEARKINLLARHVR